MKPSIDKIKKFFTLEAERNYDDKAVMGGLASILESWEAEAHADDLAEVVIKAVTTRLRDYHRLTPDSRRDALKGLWNRLRQEIGEYGDDDLDTRSKSAPAPPKTAAKPKTETPEDKTSAPSKEKAAVEKESKEPEKTAPAKEESKAPQKRRVKHQPRPKPEGPKAALDAPVTVLDGVGPKNAEKLERLNISSLRDMLYHFPRRYDDYSQLKTINRLEYGEEITVMGNVDSVATRPIRGGKSVIVEVIISDGSGALRVNWFNQPWLTKSLNKDMGIVVSGKVEQYLGRLTMTNPEWEVLDEESLHTNRIVPVFPLTANISQRWLREQMNKVVNYWALRVEETLPESVRKSAKLIELGDALLQVHFPDSWDELEDAQARLAFDEIFYLQLGVLRQKQQWNARPGRSYQISNEWVESQTGRLPYELTKAQHKAISDIRRDLASGQSMNRLIQGDVGSGKTVVAGLAVAMLAGEGAQGAVMAPTSILAEQHLKSFSTLLCGESGPLKPEEIRLLIGSTSESEKKEIRAGLADGSIRTVIGTHALLEDPIEFENLQIAVIDEQHRFGVQQRAALRSKGKNPHLLVMTATPIPRSLALTVYGDLDLTVIDEMPPGRQPVDTFALHPSERERAYALIKKQVEEGRQAFIIFPLVEESDKSDSKAAVEEHQRLQDEVFSKYKLGLLHGRLKPEEKDAIMARFRNKEIDILISTTVVEVGVDIPNATVMLIEGANRFGLAQLHQLRGRVGRGADKAYCLLIPESDDGVENERLKVMTETNDGFVLAEKDLDQRGPGQFLGTRQAGFAEFNLANMMNVRLIEKARREAQKLLDADPELKNPEYSLLHKTLNQLWQDGQGDIS
ncbi:MAG: ATP-dependent DNA helicase RecG [Anaerolineae bacterium]|nr:ATP-dependent DNA helicase RecG [Anaerolineae bacterium]